MVDSSATAPPELKLPAQTELATFAVG